MSKKILSYLPQSLLVTLGIVIPISTSQTGQTDSDFGIGFISFDYSQAFSAHISSCGSTEVGLTSSTDNCGCGECSCGCDGCGACGDCGGCCNAC